MFIKDNNQKEFNSMKSHYNDLMEQFVRLADIKKVKDALEYFTIWLKIKCRADLWQIDISEIDHNYKEIMSREKILKNIHNQWMKILIN